MLLCCYVFLCCFVYCGGLAGCLVDLLLCGCCYVAMFFYVALYIVVVWLDAWLICCFVDVWWHGGVVAGLLGGLVRTQHARPLRRVGGYPAPADSFFIEKYFNPG